jgi:hypothetical protein
LIGDVKEGGDRRLPKALWGSIERRRSSPRTNFEA